MFNFIGHTLKVVSFYLMYRAIIETGLRKPYSLLFRELQHEKIALRDAMSEYRNLVENLNEVIFKTDRLGTIQYISPQVENMLGYSPAELIGLKFSSILSEDCSDEFTHLLNETTFKSRNETVLRVRTRSGSFKWIQSNTRCIPGNNEVIGVQGIITDITKRKQEDAINSARLHLMEFAVDHSLDELLEETINEAEKVTDSS
jgi:PAS domain S-box-containing protein